MVSVSKYISENFTRGFLTIFLPLFFIGSLVFIVKLSSLTAMIQVNFWEMIQLFGFKLPEILFYTIPISFLVAISTTLLRLSSENELIALFSLGVKSKEVMRQLWIIAMLFSLLLLVLSILKIPQAKQQFKVFKAEKITQAKLNVTPSKLGQKFGNFFVYLKSKEENQMKDIVIYTKEKNSSNRLFIAKEANAENQQSVITLTLNHGSGYAFKEKSMQKINYETMQIFQNLDSEAYNYKNIADYWIRYSFNPDKRGKILFFIFISLIPILGLYIVSSFAIINPRYQKNYAYYALGITTIFLYVIATILDNKGSFLLLSTTLLFTYSIGYILFRYRVARYF